MKATVKMLGVTSNFQMHCSACHQIKRKNIVFNHPVAFI
jgi:hypothetical protein